MPLPQIAKITNTHHGQNHTPPDEPKVWKVIWATHYPTMSGPICSPSWNNTVAMAVIISTKKQCIMIPAIAAFLFLESAVGSCSRSQRFHLKVDNTHEGGASARI